MTPRDAAAGAPEAPFWSQSSEALLASLGATRDGLASARAAVLAREHAGDVLRPHRRSPLAILVAQFATPITLLLVVAATISIALHETLDGAIILALVAASGALGFWQEHNAADAVASLLAVIRRRARVQRDGAPVEIAAEAVVPGDVVLLRAGDHVPADCVLLEARDLFVDEAALTGESFPAEKRPGTAPANAPAAARTGAIFLGTHVVSGTAAALAVNIGQRTAFGAISGHLGRPIVAETGFERGVRRFGALLLEITLTLVVVIFAVNVALARPAIDSLMFAVALAVGLTPQLLPAIISVNLAHGARRMAARRVIVKRLASIENLGSMDVLCTDKTGTLTTGIAKVEGVLDADGQPSERARSYAYLNAVHATGYANPLDDAIRAQCGVEGSEAGVHKLDEVPYDFARRRLSVLLDDGDARALLVTKGAFREVLDVCVSVDTPAGEVPLAPRRAAIEALFVRYGEAGKRVIAVASRRLDAKRTMDRGDESAMTFAGMIVLADPLKPDAHDAVARLASLGVALCVLTGDNRRVAGSIAAQLGLASDPMVTGEQLDAMRDEALPRAFVGVAVFAELEPRHKERVVRALQRAGHVVGCLGDGINDAPALHAADVGLSVQGAADVATDAADIVLLAKDLTVLADGVVEGRATFANTLKYVFMATSANFGNMFSMAGASLALPFLPLLPKQVLLINLLTDLPEMTIAQDRVDPELVARPRRWDVRFIRRFMVVFGLLSSVFDVATFVLLARVLRASPAVFRTGWLIESVASAALVVLVVRTRRPLIRSRPAWSLLGTTLGVVVVTVALPWTRLAPVFGLAPLPWVALPLIAGVVAAYVLAAELTKHAFYRWADRGGDAN